MLKTLLNLFKTKPKQQTFVYCQSGCDNELSHSNSFVSDTYDSEGNNHVLYACSKCGHLSDWNFDIAPIPILWSSIKIKT